MNTLRRDVSALIGIAPILSMAACASSPRKFGLADLQIFSAGQGSAFLPYAQGVANRLAAAGVNAKAIETTGSLENIRRLNESASSLATVFLGSAHEGFTGSAAWTQGAKYTNLRALVPMYETSFQLVALRASRLIAVRDLHHKSVGVGPAGGPAENYFKALAEIAGVSPKIVTGAPTALAADLANGKIDALWQGAIVPIPIVKQITDSHDATVFGLSPQEQTEMLKRFPVLAPVDVAAASYKGQEQVIKSVAAWNFLFAHRDLSENDAYLITKALLDSNDPSAEIHPSAKSTRKDNASANRVIPFHPGAARCYASHSTRLP